EQIGHFEFLLAGFPCQPFSFAGKQRGFGDTRGTLFYEIERILTAYKPKAFLLENVRGLTSHDNGRTFKTIINALEKIGYGVTYLLLNSSNFGVPQNRVRIYILGLWGKVPRMTLASDKGSADSHRFKANLQQQSLFGDTEYRVVKDILEKGVDERYYCTEVFTEQLRSFVGADLGLLAGMRLIDYRNGQSIHSWELGIKGKCTDEECELMNELVRNRRRKSFGAEQDGKRLSIEQIQTFYNRVNMLETIASLEKKGYIKAVGGKYNPVAGNMSFEVYKFLDPESVSLTLVSSDAHKLGVVVNGKARRITPREAARIQGFPDTFVIHPTDESAYKQFGNAVSVPVVKAILTDFMRNNVADMRGDN
ncbi:MAG: DNA (cytosine-5-)-methyltransferase, partial [Armatimonadota bacterium]